MPCLSDAYPTYCKATLKHVLSKLGDIIFSYCHSVCIPQKGMAKFRYQEKGLYYIECMVNGELIK